VYRHVTEFSSTNKNVSEIALDLRK